MKCRWRRLAPELLGQVKVPTLLRTLGRGQPQEVGQLEIPLVARHQERVTQPGEAVVCGEVEEVSVVLVRDEHLARIKS